MKLAQIMTVLFVACVVVSSVPASAATMNYKLGVQSGTTSDTYAADELANAEVSGFDSIDLAVKALKQGDVDFVLGDLPVLKFYQADSEAGLSIEGSFSEEDFGIGVATGEADLLAAIDVALGEIIDSGEYDPIFTAHFEGLVVLTDDTNDDTATAYPAEPTGTLADALAAEKLVFGSDTTYPPFESLDDDGNCVGFSCDLADAIAAKIAANYDQDFVAEMKTKTWDELLAFTYDDYDATLSSMTKTAERAENTDFSRAYYSSKQGILASADSPTISGISDLNGTYEVADPVVEEEDDSPSITVLVSALAVGLIAVSRRKH